MSEEKALVPLEQKTIDFYGDEIIAVLIGGGRAGASIHSSTPDL